MAAYRTVPSSDEAARSMLRYRCRHRPELKLHSPESCAAYKAKSARNPMAPQLSLAHLCHQWECPGPVPIETDHRIEQEENPVARNKRIGRPTVCRTCGLAPGFTREDGTVVSFYPSRPDECIECIKEKMRAKKAREEQTAASKQIEQPDTTIDESLQAALEEMDRMPDPLEPTGPSHGTESKQDHKYHCKKHGPHNGCMNGGRAVKACPICFNEKRLEALRDRNALIKGASDMLKRFPFLIEWLDEETGKQSLKCSRFDLMAQIVIERIPPEWFKQWAMRGAIK